MNTNLLQEFFNNNSFFQTVFFVNDYGFSFISENFIDFFYILYDIYYLYIELVVYPLWDFFC